MVTPCTCAGTQRVDRDSRHQRGVDPARQPDHRVGEVVLPQVVPGPEDQCLVDLGDRVEHLGDRVHRRARPGPAGHGDRHHGIPRPGPRVRDGHLEIGHQDLLGELSGRGHHVAPPVDDERGTVEDELVLSPDLVDVDDGAAGLRRACAEHREALRPPAARVRRGVEVDEEACAGRGLLGHRPPGRPHVLADAHPDRDAGHLEEGRRPLPRGEPALLVEDPVIGQVTLPVAPEDLALPADRRRVDQPAVGEHVHVADDRSAPAGGGGHIGEHRQVVGHEGGPSEEVLGRISGDGELREHGQVHPRTLGRRQGVENPTGVAGQVAHHRVDLAGGHPNPRHRPSLPGPPTGSMGRSPATGVHRLFTTG